MKKRSQAQVLDEVATKYHAKQLAELQLQDTHVITSSHWPVPIPISQYQLNGQSTNIILQLIDSPQHHGEYVDAQVLLSVASEFAISSPCSHLALTLLADRTHEGLV